MASPICTSPGVLVKGKHPLLVQVVYWSKTLYWSKYWCRIFLCGRNGRDGSLKHSLLSV